MTGVVVTMTSPRLKEMRDQTRVMAGSILQAAPGGEAAALDRLATAIAETQHRKPNPHYREPTEGEVEGALEALGIERAIEAFPATMPDNPVEDERRLQRVLAYMLRSGGKLPTSSS